MPNKKVFIGLQDIASFFDDWSEGFKQNGYATLVGSLNYQPQVLTSHVDFFIQEKLDKVGYFKPRTLSSRIKPFWDRKVKEHYLNKALKECDIFLFIWDSFYADYSDYEVIKSHGKKIITVFVGDDVRWEPAMRQEFEGAGLKPYYYEKYSYSTSALNKKLQFLRTAEKYSDIILSQPNIAQLALRPYHNLLIPIKFNDYVEGNQQRKIPVLVHAPTSIGKGTQYVEAAIEKLKSEGLNFTYNRIQGMPRNEALNVYANADVIIDQLFLPGGGKLAHEGLAMGKVVLTCMATNKYDQRKPKNCPLVDVCSDNIYEALKSLILDHESRCNIATRGRSYIEQYHNPKKIVDQILKIIDGVVPDNPEFTPNFFRHSYKPETDDKLMVYNQWTEYVSTSDWYKQTISSGTRDGLIFT